jgi:hypothetical protein
MRAFSAYSSPSHGLLSQRVAAMTKTATVHAQQMWEYMELTRKSAEYMAKELNDVGQQGWELVTLLQGKDRKNEVAWVAFVKRPYVPHGSHPPAHVAAGGGAASSHGEARAETPPQKTEAAYAIGDDQEFELEKPAEETPAPVEQTVSPAAEGDDPKAREK